MKRAAAVLVSVLSLAFTANGYRPLTESGYGSLYAFGYGLFASELPLPTLGVQFTALAALSRRLSPRALLFSWYRGCRGWVCWDCSAPGAPPTCP